MTTTVTRLADASITRGDRVVLFPGSRQEKSGTVVGVLDNYLQVRFDGEKHVSVCAHGNHLYTF